MSERLGIHIATSFSPVGLRHTLCQALVQTRRPDVIAIHQNGLHDNYEWVIKDLPLNGVEVQYKYTREILPQAFFNLPAIRMLYVAGCTLFTKWDDDDLYYSNHLEELARQIDGVDVVGMRLGDVLEVAGRTPVLLKDAVWNWNPTGSMSDAVMYNRAFALEYIRHVTFTAYQRKPDDVLLAEVMARPEFKVHLSELPATTCYVTHGKNWSGAIGDNPQYQEERKRILG